MRNRACLVLVLLLLVAGACSSGGDSQGLDGSEYWSTSVSQDGATFSLVDGTRITLRFRDGALSAHAGCNSLGGDYEMRDGKLLTNELVMTEMGCEPDRQAQDEFLVSVLAGSPTVTIDGDTLRLATGSAAIDFIDEAIANPDQPLEGTLWEIDGFLSGETASSFATPVRGTVRVTDGTMDLFDGCDRTAIAVEVNEGEIRFGPVGMRSVDGCPTPPGYRQSIYTALSRGALGYSISGTNLTLATPDNVGLTLTAIPNP